MADFESDATAFSAPNALLLAQASQAAYMDEAGAQAKMTQHCTAILIQTKDMNTSNVTLFSRKVADLHTAKKEERNTYAKEAKTESPRSAKGYQSR
jgi:hypothetical protein